MTDTQFKHLCSVDTVLDWDINILQDLVFSLEEGTPERRALERCHYLLSKQWVTISILRHQNSKDFKENKL